MIQIWVSKTGGPNVLQPRESPDPTPRSGEVRIRVEASGVNYVDVLGRAGLDFNIARPPFVPGFEVAGTVDMVAQGVSGLKEGDPVLAYTHLGGYADLVCVPYRQVFRRLDWMSAQDGAALPVDYLTAYVGLVVMGSVRKEDQVLIHATDSGIGLAALHICRILGVETFGTARAARHEFLKSQGLDHPIDHANVDYEQAVRDLTGGQGVSVILNPYGGVHRMKNFRLLKPTGRLIYFGHHSPFTSAPTRLPGWLLRLTSDAVYTAENLMDSNKGILGLRFDRLWSEPEVLRRPMEQIIEWYDEALFRPTIERSYGLTRVGEAHLYLQNGDNEGKLLLAP